MISPPLSEIFFWLFLIFAVGGIIFHRSLSRENIPQRIYRSLMKKYVSLWLGVSIAILYKFHDLDDKFPAITEVWRLLPNGSLTLKTHESFDNTRTSFDKPVIFITTTDHTSIQSAILTRTAQALYPVRDMIQWIVVSLPIETSPGFSEEIGTPEKHSTFGEALVKHPEWAKEHHDDLNKLLSRFGIPYVLINSSKLVKTFWEGNWKSRSSVDNRLNQGYQTGLFWAAKYLSEGIVVVGNEQFTYNSALFREVAKTKVASCWNIDLHPIRKHVPPINIIIYRHGESLEKLKVLGYNNGGEDKLGSILIERGAFAIDLQYLRHNIPFSDHWKLAHDREFTTEDVKLDLADIQVIQSSSSLVWRTYSSRPKWPKKISQRMIQYIIDDQENITRNNVNALLKSVYGPRFHFIKGDIPNTESETYNQVYNASYSYS